MKIRQQQEQQQQQQPNKRDYILWARCTGWTNVHAPQIPVFQLDHNVIKLLGTSPIVYLISCCAPSNAGASFIAQLN